MRRFSWKTNKLWLTATRLENLCLSQSVLSAKILLLTDRRLKVVVDSSADARDVPKITCKDPRFGVYRGKQQQEQQEQ